jgi:hypothetical protein
MCTMDFSCLHLLFNWMLLVVFKLKFFLSEMSNWILLVKFFRFFFFLYLFIWLVPRAGALIHLVSNLVLFFCRQHLYVFQCRSKIFILLYRKAISIENVVLFISPPPIANYYGQNALKRPINNIERFWLFLLL